MSDRVPPAAPCGADAPAAHRFGRFVLTALEGKSRRTMVWRAQDPQRGEPMLLVLPRERPADAAAVQAWLAGVRRAGRITHPHLAGLLEAGSVERWPYALYACGAGATLARLFADRAPSVIEAVRIIAAAAEGLASAHDAGLAHHDLQPQLVLLGDDHVPRLFGLQAGAAPGDDTGAAAAAPALTHVDALQLQAQRTAARHDVLALGLLLQQLLAGKPWDDEGDVTALADRLPPIGRELVRLPWNPARPVPEALRAIANRATDRQPRQRYGSARALQRALEGWLQAEGGAGGGPIALVLDRLHAAGTLPAAPVVTPWLSATARFPAAIWPFPLSCGASGRQCRNRPPQRPMPVGAAGEFSERCADAPAHHLAAGCIPRSRAGSRLFRGLVLQGRRCF